VLLHYLAKLGNIKIAFFSLMQYQFIARIQPVAS